MSPMPDIAIQAEAGALAPCPFCGQSVELYPTHRWPGGGAPYAIDCLGCGIEFKPRDGMDVVTAWNRRS
jgi:Lar family restriction alleviation protein